MGGQPAASGGAVNISSCQNTGIYNIDLLHTLMPLSLTFTEENVDTSSYTQTQTCFKWLVTCALKGNYAV